MTQSDLERYATETINLLQRVNELIQYADGEVLGSEQGGGKLTKRAFFPAPWNTPAGHTFTTVTQAARDHELNLQLLLFSGVRFRGTSDANSYAAIRRLPILATAAVRGGLEDHNYVKDTISALAWWPIQLRRFLDDDPQDGDPTPWTKAPGNLECPHCKRHLWLRPGWQYEGTGARIYCQHCKDDEGHLLSWPSTVWLGVLQHAD